MSHRLVELRHDVLVHDLVGLMNPLVAQVRVQPGQGAVKRQAAVCPLDLLARLFERIQPSTLPRKKRKGQAM